MHQETTSAYLNERKNAGGVTLMTTLYKNPTTGADARAGHVYVICPATHFFEATVQPFGHTGFKLGGPLTVGMCHGGSRRRGGIRCTYHEGGAINIRGIL